MGVPTSKRIRSRNDFQAIRTLGKQVFCKSFICQYYLASNERTAGQRLGVIASRRVGNAVKRNRGKRIIRELFRSHGANLPPNCDIVVILRSNYSSYTFEELESHYINACAIISEKSKNKGVKEPAFRINRTNPFSITCEPLTP